MTTWKQTKKNNKRGFTLVEMIGVLAVIAILAAMLTPRVFQAINTSRINGSVQSYNALRAAVSEHYGKWGTFADSDGVPQATVADFDTTVLLVEGRIDKKFIPGVSPSDTDSSVDVVAIDTSDTPGAGDNFRLDGTVNLTGTKLARALISDVAAIDARELSLAIDGTDLSAADTATADTEGRVAYAAPVAGKTDVYLYLGHR